MVISNYLDRYQVQINSVYDTETSFEAIDGTINQTFLGTRRTLQVDFEPMETTQINALYAAIRASEDVTISYTDPELGAHTAVFTCVSLPAATYFEGETAQGTFKQFWTIPTITFIEKNIDITGGEGGSYDYKLLLSTEIYQANEISKDLKMSMSLSCEGFDVGQISSYSLQGTVIFKGINPPKRNDKVILYVRTKNELTQQWGNWQAIHVWFLKDFSLYGNGKYLKFSALDIMTFLDNNYLVEYQRDADGNPVLQNVSQHLSAVDAMLNIYANENIYNGIVSNIQIPMSCDNVYLSANGDTKARTFVQNVASSSGYNYRQVLFTESVQIEAFGIGKELSDEYIIYDSERTKLDYNFQGENITAIIIYCGGTTQLPCKIYSEISKDYDIYYYGTIPQDGYPKYSKTLEVKTPYYGVSAESAPNIFTNLIGTNFGVEFSCNKLKIRTIVPIGSRVYFKDNLGVDEFDNTKMFFYLTSANYSFTKNGIFASFSGSSKSPSDSMYLGSVQRELENKIGLNKTYKNVLIDNGGFYLASPKV